MRSFPECRECILRQARELACMITSDINKRQEIVAEAEKKLKEVPVEQMTPPEATEIVHNTINAVAGIKDLYASVKKENNAQAMNLFQSLKKKIRTSKDPLLCAVKFAIAGNIIDYGALSSFNIEETVEQVLKMDFSVNDYEEFRLKLENAGKVLYIGDNAGEIVFDRLLIEEFPKQAKTVYAVKSKPTLNDVLIEDAKFAKIHNIAQVIESGSTCPGTIIAKTTDEFKKIFKEADLIIAKGQGNFETLESFGKDVFMLLKMKCRYLADYMKVENGSIIIKRI